MRPGIGIVAIPPRQRSALPPELSPSHDRAQAPPASAQIALDVDEFGNVRRAGRYSRAHPRRGGTAA